MKKYTQNYLLMGMKCTKLYAHMGVIRIIIDSLGCPNQASKLPFPKLFTSELHTPMHHTAQPNYTANKTSIHPPIELLALHMIISGNPATELL